MIQARGSRPLLLASLLVGLVVGLAAAPATAPVAAQAPVAGQELGLDTIQAAYALLLDQFYRVSDPAALLGAAWDGAVEALAEGDGVGPLPPRPALPSDREGAWRAFAAGYPALVRLLPEDATPTDLAFVAVEAMTDSLRENHTFFLTPEQYLSFSGSVSGEDESIGLGVGIRREPGTGWIITDVAPGGPAERAGVRRGDLIVAANGRDVTGATNAEFSRAVGGPAGTEVRLTLTRPGAGPVEVSVTRGPYRFPDFEARVLPGGTGYVRVANFATFLRLPSGRPNVLQELDAALARFEAEGVTAWVIDLRGNGGGFVFTSNELIGRFLPNVTTIVNEDERGDRGVELSGSRAFPVQRPMAVLIDGGSASASESFAAAMREYGRAPIVGERSAGVLATALTFPLPEGAGLNIAVAQVRTARNGAIVDEIGVEPDVEVEDTRTPDDYATGRDPQLEAAVRAARAAPVPALSPPPFTGQLSEAALRDLLARYLPEAVAPAPLIEAPRVVGDLALNDPNRVASGAVDAVALARTVAERGWLGTYGRIFGGPAGLSGPSLSVAIDLYTSASGAIAALNTNDLPRLQREAPPPAQLGDGTVAYTGVWLAAGGAIVATRVGRTVVTVSYNALPGEEDFAPALALARRVVERIRLAPPPAPVAPPAQRPAGVP